MDKRNKLIISLFLLVSFLILSSGSVSAIDPSLVSANITMVLPGAGGTLSGVNAAWNCSINGTHFKIENWSRVRIWMNSTSLTANTTQVALALPGGLTWLENETNDDFNGTFDSNQVEDANDYEFICELWNGSTTVNKSRTGITINNTVPSATSLLPTTDPDSTVNFSATVPGRNVTSCTLYFDGINPGLSSYTMAHGGDSCSYQLTNTPEQSYRWYIRTSDESDTADSSKQTTNVDIKTGAGKAGWLAQQKGVESKGGALFSVTEEGILDNEWTWVIIIIIGIAVILIIKKRK